MGGFGIVLLGCLAIAGGALLVLVACGAFSGAAEAVQASLKAIESYGHAPVTVESKAGEPTFNERVLSPLLSRAVVMGRRLTAAENAARIQHKLDVAGNPNGWTVDRVLAMKVIGFGVGLFGSLAATIHFGFGPMMKLVCIVGATLLGYVGVNLWLYDAGVKRTKELQKGLPDAVDLLTISVEAGLGFDAAMAQVARNTEGPVASEFARLLQEMNIGMARTQAMRALGERTTLPEFRSFANALAQADSLGIPVSQVLRVQSGEMRTKRRQLAEESAQKIAVKILFPLMFCILPTLFIIVLGPAVINIMQSFHNK